MKKGSYLRLAVSLLVVAAAVAGVFALYTEAEAGGGCRCPMIYAPVICDNGKIYPNQCVADCKHAKNCQPAGVL